MTIYLDYAATTPVDPRVAALMVECLTHPEAQANPASATHGPGLAAHARVEAARAEVAALIGADPAEIIFTSGATEANNLALAGVVRAARRAAGAQWERAAGAQWERAAGAQWERAAGAQSKNGGRVHLVSARTEHKSVLDVLQQLEKEGCDVTLVEPDESGRVPPEAIDTALRPDTLLVSLMLANNETGVINDLAAVASLATARGVLVHTDASQMVGKLPVDVAKLGVDFLALTAHKFYGPKGVGALYVREGARPRIAPMQLGGGHERGLRSGTLPTHQLVGFGAAAALVRAQGGQDAAHARDLANRLKRELEAIPGVTFNDRHPDGVPGLINASFDQVEGESLVTGLPEIAVSTGSACSSATREPSYVLRALGRSTELAQSSLRLSLGRFTTAADVDAAATAIRAEVLRLRAIGGHGSAGTGRHVDEDSALASGNSLLARSLSPLARRYFLAPARPPEFPDGAASSEVLQGRSGQESEGTEVLIELKIAGGIVKSARFTAYGCPHTVAVTAWLCETLEGAPLNDVAPGTPTDWAEKFAVPAEKLGRLLVVEDALRAALRPALQV